MALAPVWRVRSDRHNPLAARRLRLAALGLALMLTACASLFNPTPATDPWTIALDRGQDPVTRGEAVFRATFTLARGLGPLYNDTSCLACHRTPTPGGMGVDGLAPVTRVGRLTTASFDSLDGAGGPVARAHSTTELGQTCAPATGIPAAANMTSVRNTPPLYGAGLIDAIPDEIILAGARDQGDGVRGRPNWGQDATGQPRIGRFGWKADTPTLRQFVADAFRNELGITNPLAPADLPPPDGPAANRCGANGLDDDGTLIDVVTAYLAALPPPAPAAAGARGAVIFQAAGCASCHTPSLPLGNNPVPLYSDLLLHDVGPDLDDAVVQGQARGRDWRTTPLWGLGARQRLLHDGRARTILAAIIAHGGEATAAVHRYRALSDADREALLAFLASL